ncbi:MAG TPA: PIG-L deacetylase family protein [Candidatus Saccharimonadales bacterium]
MTEPIFQELQPNIVLGIAAHPDDLDFNAGGSMGAFAQQGAKVYYLILTDGGKGSDDPDMTPEKLRDIRRKEQREAAQILGVTDVFFCDYPDGTLENTQDVKREVVKVIRKVKPDVVITMDPSVLYSIKSGSINHPDHRAAGQAALDAVYPLARDHLSFPELLEQGYEPHKTKTVLLTNSVEADFAVDISNSLELKFEALKRHASQFLDMPLIAERMTQWSAAAGAKYGYTYAESFVRLDVA